MPTDQLSPEDPRTRFPRPRLPEQQLEHPGIEAEMRPEPDYGVESYRGTGRLPGRRALITGGDSGIGRAVAVAFAREGADVVISHLPEEEPDAQQTIAVVEASGRRGIAIAGDVRQEEHCRELVQATVEELGGIDVLVSNAAFQMARDGIGDIPSEELDHTFRTNVYATFYLCKAALERMQPGASIITTSSIEAYQPRPPLLAYAATKAAIVNFTKGLALEAIGRGVRVNSVAPGPVWTPLIPATMPPDEVPTFGANSPIGRPAQPVEVAPAYVFLASQESSYVLGETLGVTGGRPLP
jgi:NAD(P)-dependent dehydrogenase (short-subunit alcohol dehydrogenase family)